MTEQQLQQIAADAKAARERAERSTFPASATYAVRTGVPLLAAHIETLLAIIAKHDLCHDLHGKVGRAEFEEGCRRETVKECGWAARIAELEAEVVRLKADPPRWAERGGEAGS